MMFLKTRREGETILNPEEIFNQYPAYKKTGFVVVISNLLTRAQCELLISRRSIQYPKMGLPLSLGSFQVTSMLWAVMSSISGLLGASGGSVGDDHMKQQKKN